LARPNYRRDQSRRHRRRAPDDADFVGIKTYFSQGFFARTHNDRTRQFKRRPILASVRNPSSRCYEFLKAEAIKYAIRLQPGGYQFNDASDCELAARPAAGRFSIAGIVANAILKRTCGLR
jgi:hypothetical protein